MKVGDYKPKYIALEGVSGSGKSALIHPVNELNNYRDVVAMRFTPATWVYNKLFSRAEIDYESMNVALQESHDVHVVWLQVTAEEALRRKEAKGDLERIEDLEKAAQWYYYYFTEVSTLQQVHWVNTNGRTEEEVVAEIGRKIYGS